MVSSVVLQAGYRFEHPPHILPAVRLPFSGCLGMDSSSLDLFAYLIRNLKTQKYPLEAGFVPGFAPAIDLVRGIQENVPLIEYLVALLIV